MKVSNFYANNSSKFFLKNKVKFIKKKTRIAAKFFFCYMNARKKFNKKSNVSIKKFKKKKGMFIMKKIKKKFRPILNFLNFTLFKLFLLTIENNPKKFNINKTQNFLIKKLKRRFFIRKKDFGRLKKIIEGWYLTSNYSNIEYFFKYQFKVPRYRKLKRYKSKKRFKFFHFFIKAKHSISWIKFFYINFLEKLLFYNFRLRHFWYKKKILLFFFKKTYSLKKVYINALNKKIKKQSIKQIQNRLDFSLVKLGFFKTINFSRVAISRGLVLVNYTKKVNFSFLLKEKDIVFLSTKSFFMSEFFFFEKHFFSEINQKFFVFKKRNIKFLKKKYVKFIINFLKKNILWFKNTGNKKLFSNNSYLNPFNSSFFFFFISHYSFLRKRKEYKNLNYNFFKTQNVDFLVHNHF